MAKYKVIQSSYWRPGIDYCKIIVKLIELELHSSDIVVISEKALSIAKGNLINEDKVKPSNLSFFLAKIWSRVFWGHFLCYVCRFRPPTIERLKHYPEKRGSKHKQIVINQRGLIHAFHYGSEGGIDLNNVPYAFSCLPLGNPLNDAMHIANYILTTSGKLVTLIISDTDSTFSWKNIHVSSRSHTVDGIIALNNPIAFIIGRALRLKQRATPLAIAGKKISVEEALRFSELAHRARGHGAGRTIWDSATKLGVTPTEISWELLDSIDHYPIVIIRKTQKKKPSS